jgi:hypothetical protein
MDECAAELKKVFVSSPRIDLLELEKLKDAIVTGLMAEDLLTFSFPKSTRHSGIPILGCEFIIPSQTFHSIPSTNASN